MSRKFNVGQLPTGSYSISGSFSGSFVGDGSGIQGITATAEPAGPIDSVQFNDGLNVSGSSQFTFDKTTGLVTVTSASIAGLFYPNADGIDRQTIKTDGAGNLFFGYPESITIRVKNVDTITLQKGYPVHNTSSGTSGNIIGVVGADAGDPLLMPAAAILNETLAPEAEGEALLSGFIQGVNTAGFTSGDIVYVAVGGGYTQTKPTGSALIQNLGIIGKVDPTNGSGIVYGSGRANDIPNLTEGYVWVGNTDRVATALATSSIQNVISSSYALTASFALNGGGGSTDTGSLLTTASVSLNTITFTKGDGSTFPITVDTGSGGGGGGVPDGTVSSSAQITELGFVTSSATASFVLNSQTSSMSVLSASFASTASSVTVNLDDSIDLGVIPLISNTAVSQSALISPEIKMFYDQEGSTFGDTVAKLRIGQGNPIQRPGVLELHGGPSQKGYITTFNSHLQIQPVNNKNLILSASGAGKLLISSSAGVEVSGHITASGNISASGDITANSFTGSLQGTSSYAETASYVAASDIDGTVSNALSSSHAQRSDATDTIDITQGSANTNRYVTFTSAINSDGALLADPSILYNPFSNTLTVANITGTASLASAAESVEYSNVNNKPTLISSSAQIATDISGAFAADSASFSTRITSNETNIASLTTATSSYVLNSQTSSMSVATASYVETAQTASYVLQAVSASYAPTAPGILSSSAQIATDISGAFSADSASFSTRITSNETNINTLINATSSYILASQTSSMSVATASYIQTAETASFLIAPGNDEQIIYNNNGILAGSNKLTFDGTDLDVDGIVYFRNVFNNEVDLPSVATHHGMFAHVHGTGLAYYAHVGAGGWNKLASYDRTNSDNLDIIANATMNAGTFTIAGAGNYLQVSNLRLLSNTISAQDTDGNITLTPDGTGTVDVSSKKITNLATPTTSTDAATKGYVDTATNLTASVVSASAESTDATYYPIFADSNGSAGMPIHTDGDLNYNPSTNTLSATNFVGTGSAIEGVVSASYALSASYSVTASHLLGTIDSASYSDTAVTASYALTAETLIGSIETASFAFTASFLQGTIESASYADNALTASYALTASFLQGSIDSASYASTASYVETAQTASYIDAANITTGTLTNDRLPANINVTNVTASFFTGSFVGDGSQLDGVINTPGGADTYVQINSGSTFLGTGSLVFDYTNQRLGINDSSPAYALEVSNPDPTDTDSVVTGINGKLLYSNLYTAAQSGSIPDPAVWHGMMIHYQPEGSYLVSHMSQWFRVATYANDGASIDTYGGRTQNSAGTFAPLANVEIANGYLEVDNLKMDVNTISALDTNGTIILEPSGSGTVDVSSKRITSVATPTAGTDATNKTYVDGEISTPSASFSTRITTNETDIATLTAATASYLTSLPAGVVSGSAQISYTGITDVPSGIISSSAQIASDISGSFGAASASFSIRVTDNETDIATLTAATSSYLTATPTLQEVTDQGASTSNDITISGDLTASADIFLPTNASSIRFNSAELHGRVGGSYPGLTINSGVSTGDRIWLRDSQGTTGPVTMSFIGLGKISGVQTIEPQGNYPLIVRGGPGPNDSNDGLRFQTADASNVYQNRFEIESDTATVDAYFTNINGLGINDSTPTAMLDVNGNINTTSDITASGDISAGTFTGDGSGITGVISASYAVTASYVETAQTASYVNTLSQQVVISDSTTSELLRITQTGTGDAIRIEDASNPDSTPTVINNAGDMFIGSSSAPQSGGGNSPKLYVKNGSSGYTGNLAIDTAMLFEGAGSTYFATLSPDNSFGGLYMGSPSDVFGAFIRWRHDDARLQIGAAKTNHGIEFTVGNKGATSMQLKPNATGTGDYNATLTVTGSLIVSGSNSSKIQNDLYVTGSLTVSGSSLSNIIQGRTFLYDRFGNVTLDSDSTTLVRPTDEQPSINWGSSKLYDVNTTESVDWANRLLIDNTGVGSISYSTTKRQLYDTAGSIVLDFGTVGTATFDGTASFATTASYALTAQTLLGSVTSADTASYILGSGVDGAVSNATTAATASYVAASNIDGVIQPRVTSIASSATPTPNADTTDLYIITALAVGATFGAPTGTPVQGQKLTIRIEDNGGAQSLAYNAIYRAFGATLPTTTTIGKTLYLGCIYNSTDSAWDVVAVAEQV